MKKQRSRGRGRDTSRVLGRSRGAETGDGPNWSRCFGRAVVPGMCDGTRRIAGGNPCAGAARCPRCGSPVDDDGRGREPGEGRDVSDAAPRSPPLGRMRLAWRNWVLRLIERLYWIVTFTARWSCWRAGE